MIAIKYCPDCGQTLPDPPFYCNWCGSCLNKTCLKCELLGFSKYCTQCGSEMVRPNVKAKINESSSKSTAKNDQAKNSSSLDSSKTLKQQNAVTNNEITIKVKILKGIDMKEIRLENGGGCRHIVMNKKDSLDDVRTKIKDFYFYSTNPKERYSSLGSPDNYVAVLLDFKKDDLTPAGAHFESLEKYLKDNGLKPIQGPSFYLHLLEKPKFQTTNTVPDPINQTTTLKPAQSQQSQSTYVHSFNKNKQNNLSNNLNEIHNTFLLKTPSPHMTASSSSNYSNSKQNNVYETTRLNSSLRNNIRNNSPNRTNNLNETLTKTTPTQSNKTNATNITYTKKSPLLQKPGKKTNFSSESGSDSDSSESSTSSAVVNKKTIKRTNQEINKMKKQNGSPEKKQKIDDKTSKDKPGLATKIKTEPVDATVTKKVDNLESLCLTPNSFTDNTLNIHVEQNDFKEEMTRATKNNSKSFDSKNYESTSSHHRYDDYRSNDYYRSRYSSSDKSRSSGSSRYSTNTSRYSPSNYSSNSRYSRYPSRTDRSSNY